MARVGEDLNVLQEMDTVKFTPRLKLTFEFESPSSYHCHQETNEKRDEEIGSEEKQKSVNDSHVPKVGMEFDSEEAAYQFYNEYSSATGFSIRRHTFHKNKNGEIIDRVFCCSRQGKREEDKRDVSVKSHRPETRCGCGALMKISNRRASNFRVVKFITTDSGHELVSPNKSHLLNSHRTISSSQAIQIDNIKKSGIPAKAGLSYMANQVGGRENIGFIIEDYRNYLRTKRTTEVKRGDTGGVLEYLQHKQFEDPNFFYAIQVDRDDLITNVFWADGQMMIDYVYFGDVVCFDTTYRKNKEGRPFALFVGVNHHKQTIVFGAALLYDETAETFMWLFDTFARAMLGKKPLTILTDQDAAMAKALAEKWPKTCHRLCIWHIYQNAAIHLSNVFSSFKEFSKDFSSCIYDWEDEDDFLEAWQKMLDKYDLQENMWLKRMLNKKEKWALVYGRQVFCADMTSTQRSESMNSVLRRYVNYKYNLLQFFQHFSRLIDDRRYQELKADVRTSQYNPAPSFPVEILKHAAVVYTYEVFRLFQNELCKAFDSKIELFSELGTIVEYKVTPFKKNYKHTVTYDSLQGTVSCSCKKFEFAGILCSHALKVLTSKNHVSIPHTYIKKRWTRQARKGIAEISSTLFETKDISSELKEQYEKMKFAMRYKELCRFYSQIASKAALSEETYATVKHALVGIIERVDKGIEGRATQKSVVIQRVGTTADGNDMENGGENATDGNQLI